MTLLHKKVSDGLLRSLNQTEGKRLMRMILGRIHRIKPLRFCSQFLLPLMVLFGGLLLLGEGEMANAEYLRPMAHFKPLGGWLGDVHPLYLNDAWYIYYLQVPNEPLRSGLYGLKSAAIVSRDLIHWETREVRHTEARDWWIIANLVHEGVFYSFYNGGDGIHLATSTDYETWTPYEHNPVIPYPPAEVARLRDPFVFHHVMAQEFWMILNAHKASNDHWAYNGAFFRSVSKDLLNWSTPELYFDPGGIAEPECPDMFKLGERYYLMGSPLAANRVGKGVYWMADRAEGPWRRAQTHSIDGTDFPAPNSASDGKRRLFFSWVPSYSGNRDFGRSEWAGHLTFPREVWADTDGTLYSKPPDELLTLRTHLLYPGAHIGIHRQIGDSWMIEEGKFSLPSGSNYGEIQLAGEYPRFEIRARVTLKDCVNAGFVFRAGAENFPGYEIAIDREHQQLILRHHLDRQRYLAFQSIQVQADEPMELRVFVDGSVVECFLDNRFSLVGRAYSYPSVHRIGFYSEGGGFQVEQVEVYGLKEVYTEPEPVPVEVRQEPDPRRTGRSVFFPRPFSNAHAPFHPVLNFEGSFTLECWVKPAAGSQSTKRNLIVKGDGRDPGYHYGLNLMPDDSLEMYIRSPQGFDGISSPPGSIPDVGTWFHVAGVLDTQTHEIRLYINGERVATKTGVMERLDPSNQGALRLGFAAGFHGRDAYLGLMDEVRIWNTARTDEQIRSAWNAPIQSGDFDGLVVYWDFDSIEMGDQDQQFRPFIPNRVREYPELRLGCYDGAEIFPEGCFIRKPDE